LKEKTFGLPLRLHLTEEPEMCKQQTANDDKSRRKPTNRDAAGTPTRDAVLAQPDDKGSDAKLGAVLPQAQFQNVTIWSVGLSTVHATFLNRAKIKPADPGWGDNNLIPAAIWAVTNIKDKISGNGLQIAATATGGTHIATWRNRSIQSAGRRRSGELRKGRWHQRSLWAFG
jgi:hypothetical protein